MRTTGKATDLITFSRSSGGTALRKIAYGPELVTNGTFDSGNFDGFSTVGPAWSVVSNQAVGVDTTSSNNFLIWAEGAASGKVYVGTVDVLENSGVGNTYIQWGADTNTRISNPTVGTYTQIFMGSIELFRANVNGSATNLIIDNISVKEVLFDQGDLTLFNHPADIPRIEYDANGNVLGLLVEESRTNLLTYSEDFSNATWGLDNVVVSTSSVTSPDGQQNAYEVTGIESSDGDVGLSDYVAASPLGTYTGSLWFKAKTVNDVGKYVRLRLKRVGGAFVSANTSVQLTSDWVRHEVTVTLLSDNTNVGLIVSKETSQSADNRADECLIYGAQLETGAFPTSYIPTSGSTATRAADFASIATSEFGYRDDEGTVVVDGSYFNTYTGSPYPRLIAFRRTFGVRESIEILGYNGNTDAAVFDENTLSIGVATSGKDHKVAVAVKEDDFAIAFSGGAATADTSGGMPQDISVLEIGRYGGSAFINGHIRSIKYIPRRLTNDQLVEITS